MRSGGMAGLVLVLLPVAACGFNVSAASDGGLPDRDGAVDTALDDGAPPPDGPLLDMGGPCAGRRRWSADFSVDPRTLDINSDGAKDWARRDTADSAPLGGMLAGGTWTIAPRVAILDTRPAIAWTGTTTARLRMRVLEESPDAPDPYGVVAWFNVGYDGDDYGVIIVSITSSDDLDEQSVQLYTKTSQATRVPIGAPVEVDGELVDIDLTIDQMTHFVRMDVNNGTVRTGNFTEFPQGGNADRWATLYAWDADGEFDSVEIVNCP